MTNRHRAVASLLLAIILLLGASAVISAPTPMQGGSAVGVGQCPSDIDGDNNVGILDLLMVLDAWGTVSESAAGSCDA